MTHLVFLLVGILPAIAETYPNPNPNPGNPIVETRLTADPDVHIWDGVVWMYCAQNRPLLPHATGLVQYLRMDGYHVFSSTDLVNWSDHGEILHTRDMPRGRRTQQEQPVREFAGRCGWSDAASSLGESAVTAAGLRFPVPRFRGEKPEDRTVSQGLPRSQRCPGKGSDFRR